ncbi:MAG: transposase [Proteobacteria bacterium]|nr:transposase [Pseudomonadota bacterium]
MTKRKDYSEEFKRNAILLSTKHGVKTTAKSLGVSVSCLYRWRRFYQDFQTSTDEENRSYDEILKENRALEKQIRLIKAVNEQLKKFQS